MSELSLFNEVQLVKLHLQRDQENTSSLKKSLVEDVSNQ